MELNININGSAIDDLFVDEIDEQTNNTATEQVSCSVTHQNHAGFGGSQHGAGSRGVTNNCTRIPEEFGELPEHYFAWEQDEKRRKAEELFARFALDSYAKELFLDFVRDQRGKDMYEAVYNIRCEFFGPGYFEFDEAVFEQMMQIDSSIRQAYTWGHVPLERQQRIGMVLSFKRLIAAMGNPNTTQEELANLRGMYDYFVTMGYKRELLMAQILYKKAQATRIEETKTQSGVTINNRFMLPTVSADVKPEVVSM